MARYIDADALIAEYDRVHIGPSGGARKLMVDAPTADVEVVQHARWKKVSEKSPRYVCTNCRHLFNNKGYKRCPECGARMGGKNVKK